MGLFTPIWKTKDVQKIDPAIAAVNKIDDTKKLEEIVLLSDFPPVVSADIEQIDDQSILAEIIEKTHDQKRCLRFIRYR